MRCVIWRGPGKVSLQDRPIPEPGPGEALVEILVNGLCSTDYPIVAGQVAGSKPGMVLGHEPVGRVLQVNGLDEGDITGQRVVLDTMLACGRCRFCTTGHPEWCVTSDEIGFTVDGCWSDYAVFPLRNLHVLPDTVDMLEGTLIEAITCQLGAVDGLDIRFGDSVAVIGSGPAALIFLQLAQLKGAGFVGISLLPHPGRAELALSFGADTVIDSGRADDLTQHPQVRMSVGYDVVIDAVGSEETALAALRLARRGGKVLLYGLAQNELSRFPLGEVIFRNLTLYGRTSAPHMWEPAIALLARSALRLQPLISEVVSLEQAPELVTGRRHIPNVLKRVFKIKEDGMDAI